MNQVNIRCKAVALLIVCCASLALAACGRSGISRIRFSQSADTVEAYDFVEVSASVPPRNTSNPFTDATYKGWFESQDGSKRWQVEGFCDEWDGSVYRIRFMPPAPGAYRYSVEYKQRWGSRTSTGTFVASDGRRRGPVRVDSQYPWHFVWEGTGEHYFFNGTTAYWLMGFVDEVDIRASIERLHRLKINRMRVTVAGQTNRFFGVPVMSGEHWYAYAYSKPWLAKSPNDVYHPGYDYNYFLVAFWQKLERALRFARDRDMIISLVLDMNDSGAHPAAGSEDERRFLRYAVARFAAFSNITWDLGDDLNLYRSDEWTHQTGTFLVQLDPYHHLATSHPTENIHQDRTSDWFGFTSFQEWSRKQHAFMLDQREQQRRTGRIIPQTNEEYGYEDHYPLWSEGGTSESADALRRTAWDIAMAGGYGTTGESARRGTNIWPNTGGGWMNGRGDSTMVMLNGYGHMVDFFTGFDWWKTDPHDELVNAGNYCLAKVGDIYAVYLPKGGKASIQLEAGRYTATWFDPATGRTIKLQSAQGPTWTSPAAPDSNDWALLLKRE